MGGLAVSLYSLDANNISSVVTTKMSPVIATVPVGEVRAKLAPLIPRTTGLEGKQGVLWSGNFTAEM